MRRRRLRLDASLFATLGCLLGVQAQMRAQVRQRRLLEAQQAALAEEDKMEDEDDDDDEEDDGAALVLAQCIMQKQSLRHTKSEPIPLYVILQLYAVLSIVFWIACMKSVPCSSASVR